MEFHIFFLLSVRYFVFIFVGDREVAPNVNPVPCVFIGSKVAREAAVLIGEVEV
jgi:hypothetical protein